jgi:hypothetical protein
MAPPNDHSAGEGAFWEPVLPANAVVRSFVLDGRKSSQRRAIMLWQSEALGGLLYNTYTYIRVLQLCQLVPSTVDGCGMNGWMDEWWMESGAYCGLN